MENNRNKIIRVSDLIGQNEDLMKSHHTYGEFNCYFKDHDHDEDDMVSVDDSSVFRLGEQFSSYDSLLERLDDHSKRSYVHYWRRDSRTVAKAHLKTSRPISKSLKYYSVKFACVYGGQKFMSRGKGKRATISRRTNCPSHITVRANKCGQKLEVISVCNHHNHPVSRELYHLMPHDRRLPSDTKEDVLDMLLLGFNQKRVRDYVEWETGKKLTNKDIHNLVAINKRPKIILSEKRAKSLEQALKRFESNRSHNMVTKKRRKKELKHDTTSLQVNGDENVCYSEEIHNDVVPIYEDIEESLSVNDIGNEIEVPIKEDIGISTLDGNFFTNIDDTSKKPSDSKSEAIPIIAKTFTVTNAYKRGPQLGFIPIPPKHIKRENDLKEHGYGDIQIVTLANIPKMVKAEPPEKLAEIRLVTAESSGVVYFSDEQISVGVECEQGKAYCETCGNVTDVQSDIEKLKIEREELLRETAILRDYKARMLNEVLAMRDERSNDPELNGDSVWITIE